MKEEVDEEEVVAEEVIEEEVAEKVKEEEGVDKEMDEEYGESLVIELRSLGRSTLIYPVSPPRPSLSTAKCRSE